jgi:dTDP-4-dehydrorhamnose 3,5-epimerase
MKKTSFEIEGPLLIELDTFKDNRGFFVERFNKNKFESMGICSQFVQDNFSRSSKGVLRGLHLQKDPWQGKIVTCTRGNVVDVAVDVRKNSKTLGKFVTVDLSGDIPELFWVPPGFAHGFYVTSTEGADIMYKVDSFWNPKSEVCIRWDDKDLNIPWPVDKPTVSEKDQNGISFEQFCINE